MARWGVATTPAVSPAAFKRIAATVETADDVGPVTTAVRDMAGGGDAQVHVLHVARTPLTAELFPESVGRRGVESAAEARDLVESAVDGLMAAEVQASARVLVPHQLETTAGLLLQAIARYHADLVVTHTRGLGSLRALAAGSVSHQLLQRASCPVLCLPPGFQRLELSKVAVAWDGSPAAAHALLLARRIAAAHRARLIVLHVSSDAASDLAPDLQRFSVAVLARAGNSVAETVNRAASEAGAGLVVMGSHGRGDIAAAVLGSVAHQLLEITERPVLAVRGR